MFDITVKELAGDAPVVVALAEKTVGWEDETTTEGFAMLAGVGEKLENVIADFVQKMDVIRAAFAGASKVEKMKKHLAELKQLKVDQTKELSPFRRAVALLKTAVKKKEASQLKGIKGKGAGSNEDDRGQALGDGSSDTLAALTRFFKNSFCPTHGDAFGCRWLTGDQASKDASPARLKHDVWIKNYPSKQP